MYKRNHHRSMSPNSRVTFRRYTSGSRLARPQRFSCFGICRRACLAPAGRFGISAVRRCRDADQTGIRDSHSCVDGASNVNRGRSFSESAACFGGHLLEEAYVSRDVDVLQQHRQQRHAMLALSSRHVRLQRQRLPSEVPSEARRPLNLCGISCRTQFPQAGCPWHAHVCVVDRSERLRCMRTRPDTLVLLEHLPRVVTMGRYQSNEAPP